MSSSPTVLETIVRHKWQEIEEARERLPLEQLRQQLATAPGVRDFHAALAANGPIKLIAEVKKASPSAGVIREDFDHLAIAQCYQQHGAAAISVLTDQHFFQGSLQFLREIRQHVEVPLLRKDFILDEYQLVEARAAGADAVLLIAECLDDASLKSLQEQAAELGMAALVEFYQPENASRVVQSGATIVGVNNRDLRDFTTDLTHTLNMRQSIPANCLLVGESGIEARADVELLEAGGVDAILVGQSLMESPDIGRAVDSLLDRSDEPS